jgi:type VI secretion system protein ImpK
MDGIDELTKDCFNAVVRLRQASQSVSPEAPDRVRRFLTKQIDAMNQRAARLGVPHGDVPEVTYAIAALADEIALQGGPELSQYWMGNLLQMQYFNENVAGENFFRHLDAVRSAERYGVLRVYYLCLLLGFRGRYAIRGGDMEMSDIIASVRYTLTRGGLEIPESLSPQGDRPAEVAAAPEKTTRLLWLPAVAIGAAVALYVGLSATVASRAAALTEYIGTLLP